MKAQDRKQLDIRIQRALERLRGRPDLLRMVAGLVEALAKDRRSD